MKNIENIWEEEKVKTKKVLAGFTAAAIAASMITGCGSGAKTETAVSTEAETTAAEEKETTAAETAQDTEKRKERILTVRSFDSVVIHHMGISHPTVPEVHPSAS